MSVRRVKAGRPVFTRFDKLQVLFLSFIPLALILDALQEREYARVK